MLIKKYKFSIKIFSGEWIQRTFKQYNSVLLYEQFKHYYIDNKGRKVL